jgi:hypothetical protein
MATMSQPAQQPQSQVPQPPQPSPEDTLLHKKAQIELQIEREANQQAAATQPTGKPAESSATSPAKRMPLTFGRIMRNVSLIVLVGLLMAGSFWAGRYSRIPWLTSLVPAGSSATRSELSPEQVLRQFLQASFTGAEQQMLDLCHPDLVKDPQVTTLLLDLPEKLGAVQDIKFLSIEEQAHIVVAVSSAEGRTSSGALVLKKYQGAWRIAAIDFNR